jgi:hypothetical protein
MRLALCGSERDAQALRAAGARSVRVVSNVDQYRVNGKSNAYELDSTLEAFSGRIEPLR